MAPLGVSGKGPAKFVSFPAELKLKCVLVRGLCKASALKPDRMQTERSAYTLQA